MVNSMFGDEQKLLLADQIQAGALIARGTLCPGLILVPWAHSAIWSRQHPIFVSLIQIASYKR